MAITSSIIVDEILGTVALSVYKDGITLLDTVTYTNSTLQITLEEHGEITDITPADFLKLLQLYIVFNNAIVSSIFGPSPFIFTPFTEIDNQLKNDGIDQLVFGFRVNSESLPAFQFNCTYPSGNVTSEKRSPLMTLSYAQWLYFLYNAANFKLFVLNSYNL